MLYINSANFTDAPVKMREFSTVRIPRNRTPGLDSQTRDMSNSSTISTTTQTTDSTTGWTNCGRSWVGAMAPRPWSSIRTRSTGVNPGSKLIGAKLSSGILPSRTRRGKASARRTQARPKNNRAGDTQKLGRSGKALQAATNKEALATSSLAGRPFKPKTNKDSDDEPTGEDKNDDDEVTVFEVTIPNTIPVPDFIVAAIIDTYDTDSAVLIMRITNAIKDRARLDGDPARIQTKAELATYVVHRLFGLTALQMYNNDEGNKPNGVATKAAYSRRPREWSSNIHKEYLAVRARSLLPRAAPRTNRTEDATTQSGALHKSWNNKPWRPRHQPTRRRRNQKDSTLSPSRRRKLARDRKRRTRTHGDAADKRIEGHALNAQRITHCNPPAQLPPEQAGLCSQIPHRVLHRNQKRQFPRRLHGRTRSHAHLLFRTPVHKPNHQQHGGRQPRGNRTDAAEIDRNHVRALRQRHQDHDKIGTRCPERFQRPGGLLPSDGCSPRADLRRRLPANGDVDRMVPLHHRGERKRWKHSGTPARHGIRGPDNDMPPSMVHREEETTVPAQLPDRRRRRRDRLSGARLPRRSPKHQGRQLPFQSIRVPTGQTSRGEEKGGQETHR